MCYLVHSSVKFSGAAFRNAYKYFNKKEDGDTVRRYENYMKGEGASSTVFRVSLLAFGCKKVVVHVGHSRKDLAMCCPLIAHSTDARGT